MSFSHALAIFASLAAFTMAQSAPAPPQMTLIYSMEAKLGDRFSLGPVPSGQERIVIPIVGGTFKGPRLSGKSVTFHNIYAAQRRGWLSSYPNDRHASSAALLLSPR
jgi:hypothetical protein